MTESKEILQSVEAELASQISCVVTKYQMLHVLSALDKALPWQKPESH